MKLSLMSQQIQRCNTEILDVGLIANKVGSGEEIVLALMNTYLFNFSKTMLLKDQVLWRKILGFVLI